MLRSDLPVDDAIDVLGSMEDARAGMLAGMWPGEAGPTGRTQAVALSSYHELSAFIGARLNGIHLRHPPFPPTIVLAGSGAWQSTAMHELAHELALHFLPVEPPWYAEGLATFLESVRYDRGRGRSSLGEPSQDRYQYFRSGAPMSLEKLLGRMPDDPFEQSQFYATSWLLTHYLYNKRPGGWQRLQRRLGGLQPAAQAFRDEFPDLDAGGLDSALREYVAGGAYVVEHRNLAPWAGTPSVRAMTDSEVHGVRAYLYWSMRGANDEITEAAIRAELDEALHAELPALEALAVAFYGPDAASPARRNELAEQAKRTYPDRWMAWVMAADVQSGDLLASRADLFRGLRLAPDEPEILIRLAAADEREGLWDDALDLTNRVLGAGAVHHDLWLMHLMAMRETGLCPFADRWAAALLAYFPPQEARAVDGIARLPCREHPAATEPSPRRSAQTTP